MEMFVYLLVVFVLISIIGFSYSINRTKQTSILDCYLQYISNNPTVPPPLAFTYAKVEGNKYQNYYFDSISGKFVAEIEDWPVNLDGTKYNNKLKHGNIIERPNGFEISGIVNKFTCPDDKWIWDPKAKTCVVRSICNGFSDINFIKGLTKYHFHSAVSGGGNSNKFHHRIYATCVDQHGNFTIDSCPNNMLFNQQERQEVVLNEVPCDYYDICNENINNFTHRSKISNEENLKSNEYYVCKDGVSQLKSCSPPLVYDAIYGACIELGPCWGKTDNTSVPIPGSDLSYYLCKNQQEHIVKCDKGIYEGAGPDKLECINTECGSEKYETLFSNSYFSYPVSALVCRNNKLIENKCDGIMKEFSMSIDQPPSFYAKPKYNFYDKTVEYFSTAIKYRSTDNFEEETMCVDLNETNIKEYALKSTVAASYNHALGKENWNFLNKTPVDMVYKYFNIMGTIYRLSDNVKIGPAEDYVAMMGSNRLYLVKNIVEKSVDTNNGIVTSFHAMDSNGERFKTYFRIGSFAHMLFPCGFETYRMLVYDQIDSKWLILDWQHDMLVDKHNIQLGSFGDSVEYTNKQEATFSPPKTTLFKTVLPSPTRKQGLSYHISSCNWDSQFVDLETVVKPHFILPIKYVTISDLNGYKCKIVAIIDDYKDISINDMLRKISIINEETAPKRKNGQSVEEYFDKILDEKIYQLITEPGKICLREVRHQNKVNL